MALELLAGIRLFGRFGCFGCFSCFGSKSSWRFNEMRQLQMRCAAPRRAYITSWAAKAKVVRCCRRDATLSASAELDLASPGPCQNIFVAALNEFNDAASARNIVDGRVGVVFVAVSGHKIDCLSRLMYTAPRHPFPSIPLASLLVSSGLISSVCPSVSLSVCVSRCLPYAAPCLRMHVAFSGGRACTDRCIDMPKRWLFLFLAGLQFARTVG